MTRGDGSFPPDLRCVCGCTGDDHKTRWNEDGSFKGTRCDLHGGHKFQPKTD